MQVGELWKHDGYNLTMRIDRITNRRVYLSRVMHLSGSGFVDRHRMDTTMFINMFSKYYNFNDYYEVLKA